MRLPRGYLSWSQLTLWEHSELDYAAKYILHQPQRVNSGIIYGKYVADSLDGADDDETITKLRSNLPAYDRREHAIEAQWKGVRLVGRLDTYRTADHAFREYKTGRRDRFGKPAWTLAKAKEHGQIRFYAFMLWIKTRKLPPPAFLDWIETEVREDGTVGLADNIESFEVHITMDMLLDIGSRIERAANEISKQYDNYLKICRKQNQQKRA